VILIFALALMALAFVLYYTRAIPLGVIDRINEIISPKKKRRKQKRYL